MEDQKSCLTCKYGSDRKQETCEGCSVHCGRWVEANWHKEEREIKDMTKISKSILTDPYTI